MASAVLASLVTLVTSPVISVHLGATYSYVTDIHRNCNTPYYISISVLDVSHSGTTVYLHYIYESTKTFRDLIRVVSPVTSNFEQVFCGI